MFLFHACYTPPIHFPTRAQAMAKAMENQRQQLEQKFAESLDSEKVLSHCELNTHSHARWYMYTPMNYTQILNFFAYANKHRNTRRH